MKQTFVGLLSLMWLSAAFADTVQVEFSGVITAGAVSGELGGPYPTEINFGSTISGSFVVQTDEAPFSTETEFPAVVWLHESPPFGEATWISLPIIEIDNSPGFSLAPACPPGIDCGVTDDQVFVTLVEYPDAYRELSFVRRQRVVHGLSNNNDWLTYSTRFNLYLEILEAAGYLLADNVESTGFGDSPFRGLDVDSFSIAAFEGSAADPFYRLDVEFSPSRITITNLDNPPVPIPVPMPFVMLLSGLMLNIPLTRQRGPRSLR